MLTVLFLVSNRAVLRDRVWRSKLSSVAPEQYRQQKTSLVREHKKDFERRVIGGPALVGDVILRQTSETCVEMAFGVAEASFPAQVLGAQISALSKVIL